MSDTNTEQNAGQENIESFPVLTKDDLISILEALFKFSQEPNNAILRKEDGLYVLDFHKDFEEHINNTDIHPTKEQKDILANFSLDNDVLNYKGKPIVISVSGEEGNAIIVKPDGLYIKDYNKAIDEHIKDTTVHITKDERDEWNSILDKAKKYADQLPFYTYQKVDNLPNDEQVIKDNTIYLLKQTYPESNEIYYVRYIYREHKWIPLDITIESIKLLAHKSDLLKLHTHDNKDILDKFTEDEHTGNLLYNGSSIYNNTISQDKNNAIGLGTDGKLYVKNLEQLVDSIAKAQSGLSKKIILDQECDKAKEYTLDDDINNYNYLMIHYYTMPDTDTETEKRQPYDAKTEILDVDNLNDLYKRGIDYILEHDYGFSTYNTKIRFHDNIMQILYYNHICIYQIIGVH